MRLRLLALCALLAAACQHTEQAGIPQTASTAGLADFVRFEKFADAKLSPRGKYVAAITTENGNRELMVIDVKSRKQISGFRADPGSVGDFYWANDERILVGIWNEGDGTLARPRNAGEIYAINATTGRGEMLFGYRAARDRPGPKNMSDNAELMGGEFLARMHPGDRQVLVEAVHFHDAGDRIATLLAVDVYSARQNQITVGPMPGADFITDENGEPRIAHGRTPDQKPKYFYRDPSGPWTDLSRLTGVTNHTMPLRFDAKDSILYVVEPIEKGFGVFAVDVRNGERKLLSKNEWVGPAHYLEDTHQRLLAVEYDPDVPTWDFVVPDHPLCRALKGLLAAYPDDNVRIVNITDDEKKALVFVYSDRNPGKYLLVDVAKLSVEEIVSTRPWVKPQEMAETTAFHIRASDGMWIHGFVTEPRNAVPGKPPPLVVFPHGGPHGPYDVWRYQPETQLLASQGFAVLQVNYRGSGGYGLRFQEAGYRHWGDRMIEDILDATRYAIGKGYGDGKRVCAYGGSYGAFASMQSAVLAPDLFRCVVGVAGVYDLVMMKEKGDIPDSRQGIAFLKVAVGTDDRELRRQSPAFHADQIRAKVLLIHGTRDERAPLAQAEE
ncbi:MAG TPA: alpha/beta fold hydrolase, partial [Myxococcales bacterium]